MGDCILSLSPRGENGQLTDINMGFSEDRAQGRLGPAYLLIAENPYILWEAEEFWKSAWRRAAGHDIVIQTFVASQIDFEELLGSGATVPMFDTLQPVIIRTVEKVPAKRQDEFLRIIKQSTSSTKWLFTSESIDRRTSFYKALAGLSEVEVFPRIYPEQISGWVKHIADDFNVLLAPAAIELLASVHGNDFFAVRQTIERATLFLGRTGRIESSDLEVVLAGEGEHDVYQLVEAASRQDFATALIIARSLWAGGDESRFWLGAIYSQCVQYLQIIEMGSKSNEEIGRALGKHPFVISKARMQAKAFGEERLVGIARAVFATDYSQKSSRLSPGLAWELMVWLICGPPQRGLASLTDRLSTGSPE